MEKNQHIFSGNIDRVIWRLPERIKGKTEAEQKEKLVIWAYYETQAQRNGLNELVKSFNQSQNE